MKTEHLLGPTACIAHPKVLTSIHQALRTGHILSAADARLARRMGMLHIPGIGRSGWNDGMIYPTDEPTPTPARSRLQGPLASLSMRQPSGPLHALALLVDFADNPGQKPREHFQHLLFDEANPDSMASFYREVSYGKLRVTGEVVGWLRAPHPYAHYTAGDSGTGEGFPRNTPGLLQDVLTEFCRQRSLADFDRNGDNFVDGLFLIHAGAGAEEEPDEAKRANMIWSHKWTLPTPFENQATKAFAYFTAPETGKLGVFAHEFGHFLGLPDLYDTSYRSQGAGDWCLMAGGSWNGAGEKPARLSAWCLSRLGWIKPTNVTKARALTLDTLANDSSHCYRLWTKGKKSPEYFLLENRQKKGRDSGLPGSGLALWHVDERQSDNTNPIAYRVGLVQADGRRDLELNRNQGDGGDLFPGTKRVHAVADTGVMQPSTRAHDGEPTGVALRKIRLKSGIATVEVAV